MRTSASIHTLTGVLLLVCLALSACTEAEPESTACPLPTFPDATTTPEGSTTPAPSPSSSICNGESLTSTEAFALLQDASLTITVVDTRTPAEYAAGHIPGAVNLSTQDAAFWDQLGELPAEGTYLLYCRTGSTTGRVVERMPAMGFTDVCHIGDGFNGWKAQGLPVEEGGA